MAGSSEIGYRLPIHDATELAKHALFVVCGVCATCRMLPPEPAYTVPETQTEAHVCQLPHMHFTLREANPRRPPSAKILNEKKPSPPSEKEERQSEREPREQRTVVATVGDRRSAHSHTFHVPHVGHVRTGRVGKARVFLARCGVCKPAKEAAVLVVEPASEFRCFSS
jgi:hypothetical protein